MLRLGDDLVDDAQLAGAVRPEPFQRLEQRRAGDRVVVDSHQRGEDEPPLDAGQRVEAFLPGARDAQPRQPRGPPRPASPRPLRRSCAKSSESLAISMVSRSARYSSYETSTATGRPLRSKNVCCALRLALADQVARRLPEVEDVEALHGRLTRRVFEVRRGTRVRASDGAARSRRWPSDSRASRRRRSACPSKT